MSDAGTTVTVAKAHDYLSDKALKLVGGLFMEQKGDDGAWVASKGAVMLWAVFAHMFYLWQSGGVPADTEMTTFEFLLGYQGLKIGKDGVASAIAASKS